MKEVCERDVEREPKYQALNLVFTSSSTPFAPLSQPKFNANPVTNLILMFLIYFSYNSLKKSVYYSKAASDFSEFLATSFLTAKLRLHFGLVFHQFPIIIPDHSPSTYPISLVN